MSGLRCTGQSAAGGEPAQCSCSRNAADNGERGYANALATSRASGSRRGCTTPGSARGGGYRLHKEVAIT